MEDEFAASSEIIELPYTPEYDKRELGYRLGGVGGMVLFAHIVFLWHLYRATSGGAPDSIERELYWFLGLVIIDCGIVAASYYLLRRYRITFDCRGITWRTFSRREKLLEWNRIEKIAYTDLGGPALWVQADGTKLTLMPKFYREPNTIRQILAQNIPSTVTLPDFPLN